jgi:putative colanic acid biosynthesis glycosyltransferase
MPLFTIITVTYNAEHFIEASLQSVVGQTCKDYEYIIIDGGSTDQTFGIIQKYAQHTSHFISEKDNGIYDAMNKAIELSSGDYLLFLGADDLLYSEDTLANMAALLGEKPADLLIGKVMYTSRKVFISRFSFSTLLNNTVHHQGTFYNRTLFSDFRFDLQFRLIADYELNLRLYKSRKMLRTTYADAFISLCTDGGVSRSQLKRAHDETNAVRKKVLGRSAIVFQVLYEIKFLITTRILSQ